MKTVYWDMDGVLVDLYGSMKKMLGKQRIEHNMQHDRGKWFEEDLVEFTDLGGFYTADAMPRFKDVENIARFLFLYIRGVKFKQEILTSLGGFYYDPAEVARQKRAWLFDRSPEIFAMIPFNYTNSGKEKANYALSPEGERNILIDDTVSNNEHFRNRGGIAFNYSTENHVDVSWNVPAAVAHRS